MVYKYIYHLADLHIRPLDRHQEYTQVFQALIESIITSKSESAAFVCGDLFHSREKLLSETILLFDKFITLLQERVQEIFIIPGNHDSFKSANRLDSIKGIVDIARYPQVTFITESGTVISENIAVHALFDGQPFPEPVTGKFNIAMYHGIVHKDQDTFFGVVYRKVSDFKDYSLTLLGDIHQFKLLSDNIGYPGSLIQQNFAESEEKGYILWEIGSKKKVKSTFVKVPNEWSFKTIHISEKLNELAFTKNSRVRVIINNLENLETSAVSDIREYVQSKTNVISFTKEFKLDTANEIGVELAVSQAPAHEKVSQLEQELFDDSLKKHNSDPEKIKRIYDIHKGFKAQVNYNETMYSNSWKISSLEFKNVFIYGSGDTNVINFQDGITGILGNNAIGKSCILYIIIYALFGQVSKTRNHNNKNIIHKTKKDCFIKIKIQVNETEYIITRTGKPRQKKGTTGINETVTFTENGTDITLATKTDTEQLIKSTLGITSIDDFIFTNIISNILHRNVLTMTNTELETVMGNLFNTNVYKELSTAVKAMLKQLNTEIKVLEGKQQLLLEKLEDLDKMNASRDEVAPVETLVKELDKLNSKKKELLASVKSISTKLKTFSFKNAGDSARKRSELNSCIQVIKEKNDPIPKEPLEHLTERLAELAKRVKKLKSGNLVFDPPNDFDDDIDYTEKLNKMQNYLKYNASSTGTSGTTGTTGAAGTALLKTAAETKAAYKKGGNVPEKYTTFVKDFFLNYIKKSKQLVQEHSANEIAAVKESLALVLECKEHQDYLDLLDANQEFTAVKQKIKIHQDHQEIEYLTQLAEHDDLYTKKQELEQELEQLNEQIVTMNLKLVTKKQYKQDLAKVANEIAITTRQVQDYTEYKDLVSEKGLPKMILQKTISNLQNEANEIIYTLCNLIVRFDITETSKWDLTILKNDMVLGPEQCSGYERFIINIALKIVFDKYKFYSGIKMFFIDEGLDCISEENFDKLDQLFGLLKGYYKNVLVISHNDQLKKKVERTINISTDFVTSKIVE